MRLLRVSVWVILLLVLTISLPQTRNLFGIRSILSPLIYPFQFAGDALYRGVRGGVSYVAGLNRAAIENAYLKQELDLAQAKLKLLEELKQENIRLKGILRFKQDSRFNLLAARVIGKSPTPWFSIININKGRASGIRVDMPVIGRDGLVGRVIEVYPLNSKVMLLVDPESSVAAADERSRDFGMAEGALPNKLFLKYVDAKGDVQIGDTIVTSHLSDIFPAGIQIGQVLSASKKEYDLFYRIELKPAVDFSKLEEVFVVL